jgi:hypothetical protein
MFSYPDNTGSQTHENHGELTGRSLARLRLLFPERLLVLDRTLTHFGSYFRIASRYGGLLCRQVVVR